MDQQNGQTPWPANGDIAACQLASPIKTRMRIRIRRMPATNAMFCSLFVIAGRNLSGSIWQKVSEKVAKK
jgi:hypothetical protein